ncbi:MAG: maleylacetoacetate isomerase, partial [Gammaproteobacteria bacterium]|nr:maleylacetoacetate isomerase [Gammaproteobacteria bacterium]
SQYIACEIHPLNNLRILRYLVKEHGWTEDQKMTWYRHWVELGLNQFEELLTQSRTSKYCLGDSPSMVECLLIPQVTNALRFNANLDKIPQCLEIYQSCMDLVAFQNAKPENCPDFKPN